jgi:(1->4)-alpha-D-glucan 1-alpha-D-glucosylmutase
VGYEFLDDVCALWVDPAGEAPLTELWEEIAGDGRPFGEWAAEAKLEQARGPFAPDADWLRRLWPGVEGVEEALSAMPVYRTYIRDGDASEQDREVLEEAGLTDWLASAPAPFVTRFQQMTPAIMAKGVEDTAFYRYARLLALNDVGGDPSRFGIDVETFHAANRERAERFPRNLLVTQTHDTKRSGDVRARIGAISTMPREWTAHVRRWFEACSAIEGPDPVERYFVFQTLAGAWPIDPDRLVAYMEKAGREAKRNTNWIEPDEAHEAAVARFCRALYDHAPFRADFEPFAEELARAGDRAALGQLLLKLTVPGVPDVYQGDELLALSLVDPDNRREVDWGRRRELLAEIRAGAPPSEETHKLWLIHRALDLRARLPEAFAGSYEALEAGADTCAFVRGGDVVVAVAIRGDGTRFELPAGEWRDVLADDELTSGLAQLLYRVR